MATQAMTFECVKCRRGPRTSQIPSSGRSHAWTTKLNSARPTFQPSGSAGRPDRRDWNSASATSPYTSSWNCL
jgi:hypothetical protein